MGINADVKIMIDCLSKNDYQRAKQSALCVLANDKAAGNERWRAEMKNRLLCQDVYAQAMELPHEIRSLVFVEDVQETFLPKRYHLSEREGPALSRICDMRQAASFMESLRIRYLNATLLFGESGVGKTDFGRLVAHEFGLPFVYLNFSRTVDSYLGKTSQNISAVFDWVRDVPCVFMLDELDCISMTRKGSSGGVDGELSRITITLIQELDRLSNGIVLLAATNRVDCIDAAVLRRFSLKHEVRALDAAETEQMVLAYLEDVGVAFDAGSVRKYATRAASCRATQSSVINHVNASIAKTALAADGRTADMEPVKL